MKKILIIMLCIFWTIIGLGSWYILSMTMSAPKSNKEQVCNLVKDSGRYYAIIFALENKIKNRERLRFDSVEYWEHFKIIAKNCK